MLNTSGKSFRRHGVAGLHPGGARRYRVGVGRRSHRHRWQRRRRWPQIFGRLAAGPNLFSRERRHASIDQPGDHACVEAVRAQQRLRGAVVARGREHGDAPPPTLILR